MSTPFYSLGMFPYPSGVPHLGHVRVYTLSDVRARHAHRSGREVLHPVGWDAFGLPAELAAVRHGLDPVRWTEQNIAQMRATFRRMGWSFDWSRELSTADPAYYRWTQWLFLQLHRRGLAYEAEGWVHWCPSCETVLADEQVEQGACWRCHAAVTRTRRRQWMFRITAYAQALWDGLDDLTGWDRRAVAKQRHWIGRSEGCTARFGDVAVFTTRIDTLPGVVAVVVAPEHPRVQASTDPAVQAYAAAALAKSSVERLQSRDHRGVALGQHVPHPLSGEPVPLWVAEYVVGDYGTGAVMCVPAHDERDAAFAATVGLPAGTGELRDPGEVVAALQRAGTGEPTVSWNLRDWSVGRQRAWGCPVPVVRCPTCGAVPVAEDELPVTLDAPIDRPCPACGGEARRETDTLDTFVCSSWYAFRFTDPRAGSAPFAREQADRFLPIDVYVGGLDHSAQHMLYFRFVTRVLHDLGCVGVTEPVRGFVANGMVLDERGRKMSKSLGNSPDIDALIDRWGAPALRLATLADSPPDRDVPFEEGRVEAKSRFLAAWAAEIDAWREQTGIAEPADPAPSDGKVAVAIRALDGDIGRMALHNAVARLHTMAKRIRPRLRAGDPGVAGDLYAVLRAIWPLVPGWVEARHAGPHVTLGGR